MELLRERWELLTKSLEREICEKWWSVIRLKYEDPSRKYHTVFHLQNMFEHMDLVSADIKDKTAVSYAIFFHDVVYDPQSQDNDEQSINLFRNFAEESGLIQECVCRVVEMIRASKSHCTEEHKTEGSYGRDDIHFFLDFDVAVLGAHPTEYTKYAEQIEQEYSFLSPHKYRLLRSKVLQLFLQIPNIFCTKPFREKYESQARENIEREIIFLSSKT